MSYFLFTLKCRSLGEDEDVFIALGYTVAESVDEAEENLKNAAKQEQRSIRKFESGCRYEALDEPRMLEAHRKRFEMAEEAPHRSVIVPFETSTLGEPSLGFPSGQFAPA